MNLKPLGDRVVVEPIEQDERTQSGLYIPETAKEKPQRGTITAIGQGAKDEEGNRIPLDVETGQTVLYAKYAGTEFKLNGKKLLVMKENDILAVLEE